MNPDEVFRYVDPAGIDFSDHTYSLTPWEEQPDDMLLRSISRFGVLHPPILRALSDRSYLIVAGRMRILAHRQYFQGKPIMCRIVPADRDDAFIFSILLEESLAGTPFTPLEQLIFLQKLKQASSNEDAEAMLEKLGHKKQPHILKDLLKLLSLDNSVLLALHTGKITMKNARKLLQVASEDQVLLVRLIKDLHLGGSKQQKLIDLSFELSKRTNISLQQVIAEFLHSEAGQAQAPPENIPQQSTALLNRLQAECFPRLTEADKSFKHKVAILNLPSHLHISHTPSFEDTNLTLSVRFPDWQALEEFLNRIKRLIPSR